jgi:cytoskeletal protein RodZ
MSEEKLTLGQYIKIEREKREIALKEIEQITKIPAQTLKFLEEDQIDVLPPRAFLRGFLQVISKEFDFDEEELVRHLDETLAAYGKKDEAKSRFKRVKGKSSQLQLIIICILIFIIAAVIVFSLKTCNTVHQSSAGTYSFALSERIQGEGAAGS